MIFGIWWFFEIFEIFTNFQRFSRFHLRVKVWAQIIFQNVIVIDCFQQFCNQYKQNCLSSDSLNSDKKVMSNCVIFSSKLNCHHFSSLPAIVLCHHFKRWRLNLSPSQLETSKYIENDQTIWNKTNSVRNKITTLETSNWDSKQKG